VVDLTAVKAATRAELADCAIAAARNAQGLLNDAELLAASGRKARAYSLAVLAVEESGKALTLVALAVLPERLRAQAPLSRMLEWHQLKLVGGLLMAVLPPETMVPRLATMTDVELFETLSVLDAPADEADQLKRRGFYVDMERGRRIREPSEITETDVESQLSRARLAATSVASALLGPNAQARLAHPPAEGVELVEELVAAITAAGYARTGYARTPRHASDVFVEAIVKFRERKGS